SLNPSRASVCSVITYSSGGMWDRQRLLRRDWAQTPGNLHRGGLLDGKTGRCGSNATAEGIPLKGNCYWSAMDQPRMDQRLRRALRPYARGLRDSETHAKKM